MEELRFTGLRVEVRPENNRDAQLASLEKAMKIFKKKLEKDGVLRIAKERRYFTKPSALRRSEEKKRRQENKSKRDK